MWGSLRHPNVLPLLGVPKDRSRFKFAMVSEWMPNGRINEFVRAQRDVNRFKLVRFPHGAVLRPLTTGQYSTCAVGRQCSGIDLFAWSEGRPRGSQGGASLKKI